MKSLTAFLAALSVWMAIPSCSHVQTAADIAKTCASAETKIIVADITPDVASALECSTMSNADLPPCLLAALENIGKRVGSNILTCAVEAYPNTDGVKAALNPMQSLGQKRARTWLATHGGGLGGGPSTAAVGPPS